MTFPQTGGYNQTFDGPQAGEVWRVGPTLGAPPTRLVAATAWGIQSLVMVFTLNLDGSAAGIVIDGASYTVAATTLTQLIDGLNGISAFAEQVVAGIVDGDATKIRFAWIDHAEHTVVTANGKLTTPTVVTAASGDQFLEPGMGAAYRPDNGCSRPTTLTDRLFGIVLRAGLPSATEATLKGGRAGQWPVTSMPMLERRDESGLTVPCVSTATAGEVAYWICSGINAGKFRSDNGGRGEIQDVTLTVNATDMIGFAVDGLEPVVVESVLLATDAAALAKLFNSRADMKAIGVATVVSNKVRITFSDNVAHSFTDESDGTAAAVAAVYQTPIAAIAKACTLDPRITFASDLAAPGIVRVEIG